MLPNPALELTAAREIVAILRLSDGAHQRRRLNATR